MPRDHGPIAFESSPWHVHHGEPTTLLVFLQADAPPQREAVTDRFVDCGAQLIELEQEDKTQPDVIWQSALKLPCVRDTAIVWCERAQPVSPGTFGDSAIESCTWIVGVQTLLHIDDPAESYAQLLQLLTHELSDATGVLDLNTNMCHPRNFITDQLALPDAPAPIDWLWRVHVVASKSADDEMSMVWLRTSGLHRCWRAELEMFNVPQQRAAAAGRVLHLLAEHALDDPLPKPGAPFEIGANLAVQLCAAQDACAAVGDEAVGSTAFRRANGIALDQPTAVVVAPSQQSGTAPAPPMQTLEALAGGDAAVFRTIRATARQAVLARAHWPEFISAWNDAQHDVAAAQHFLVKAAVTADESTAAEREHLWFEVQSVDAHNITATPLHDAQLSHHVTAQDTCELDPEGISDWLIFTPTQRIGPATVRSVADKQPQR